MPEHHCWCVVTGTGQVGTLLLSVGLAGHEVAVGLLGRLILRARHRRLPLRTISYGAW